MWGLSGSQIRPWRSGEAEVRYHEPGYWYWYRHQIWTSSVGEEHENQILQLQQSHRSGDGCEACEGGDVPQIYAQQETRIT